MSKSKRNLWKSLLLGLASVFIVLAALIYREFYPPLPNWIKPPPESRVQISRRFRSFPWGPQYYCRIHSPLQMWDTARYLKESSEVPYQQLAATQNTSLTDQNIDMNGWELKRLDKFISVDYFPSEIREAGTEVYSSMRVWPEADGSTIEFYFATGF